MQLLRANEVEVPPDAPAFRSSPFQAVLIATLVVAFAVFTTCLGAYAFSGIPRYVSYYVALMLLLSLFLLRGLVISRFRADNWLARIGPSGIFLKFRSYLNYALPASDKTVVFIPYDELRAATLLDERLAVTDSSGERTTQRRAYVQFDVATDVTALDLALSAERAKTAPRVKQWYGTAGTIYNDYPVSVVRPCFIRVRWSAVPGAGRFLEAIRPFVHIEHATVSQEDLDGLSLLPLTQQVQQLRELDASGRTLQAIATARRLYGYDLRDAKTFVEKLRR